MRSEFTKKTKREAMARAGNGDPTQARCEAIGRVYGQPERHRCNWPLSYGVEFDHYPDRAADGGSNELSNCVAVCLTCHSFKTRTFDTPQAAKGKRISDKHLGIRRSSQWATRPLGNGNHQHSATRTIQRKGDLR
jgi:hypothetical protein